MKTIKVIYNEALYSGYLDPEKGSPWNLYKPKKGKSSLAKLNEEQITAIEKLDLRPGINLWHSRNIFLLSFYLQGMRTADIMQLRWEQVREDRVEYVAGKTEKFRSKKLIQRAKAIIEFYRYPGLRPGDYVFPFLKGKNKRAFSEDEWVKLIGSANALINGHLMTIAEKIGVKRISMHVARHSFADIANKKTSDVHKVSDALDHSSVSVTEITCEQRRDQKMMIWLLLCSEINNSRSNTPLSFLSFAHDSHRFSMILRFLPALFLYYIKMDYGWLRYINFSIYLLYN